MTQGASRQRSARRWDTLRVAGGIVLAVLLALLSGRIRRFGNACMYAATWVTVLHIGIGEYVFLRHLHARSRIHRGLDLMAFLFLAGGIASFSSPALWCAFFGALFALAIAKYLLIERTATHPALRKYAHEKIRLESPAVAGLAMLAAVFDRLEPRSGAVLVLELAILSGTVLFAVWMIAVRHVYRRVLS